MISHIEQPCKPEQIRHILNPIIDKWFFTRFKEFSLPQLFGVMEIHSRSNILISAPTGATKTLTAFLSILNELIDSSEKGILENRVYCIYVSPLKALSNDIQVNLVEPLREMEKLSGKKLNIRVGLRTGDTSASERAKMLVSPPHILITTPESLAIILSSVKFRELLKNTEWLIIDEIHALAENKRGAHLSLSVERLNMIAPSMARIGLSATVAPLEEVAKFLVGYENESNNKSDNKSWSGKLGKTALNNGLFDNDGLDNGGIRNCKLVDVQFIKNMDLKVLSPVQDLIGMEHAMMHNSMYALIDSLIQSHRTTLVFTNTRSATERVVHHLKEKYPKKYTENIGAHHGSLSKTLRHRIEGRLRKGELKAIVSSTSLELGIDIGYIDLVICLGSPKSVARFLQRAGRSGHKLHDTVKARIIVLDRDDLVECAVLLKSAIEKKIDKLHIPKNCLDVLAQQIHGMSLEQRWNVREMFNAIRQSYTYHGLEWKEFIQVIEYLAGRYVSLEDRHIYAKIWYDEETGELGRKGKMSRVIHLTNIGTIPEEAYVTVKVGEQPIGSIDEGFLERLKRGDVFVLGGERYEFLYAKGMVAYVNASVYRQPTIPSWFSEMLPLSFELSLEIGRFRKLMNELFCSNKPKNEIVDFIFGHVRVDKNAAESIYEYFSQQFSYAEIPSHSRIIVEHYSGEQSDNHSDSTGSKSRRKYAIFHTLYGRRVNDCISRAVAFAIARTQHRDVEIGINDNGFYLGSDKNVNVMQALKLIKSKDMRKLMDMAIEQTEVLKRRFRHCASRAMMILRRYKGHEKRVGRQQVSSMILLNAVRQIDSNFCILKEARREVLEDLMDIENAAKVIEGIEKNMISVKEIHTNMPSPFAFNLILQGFTDIMKIEDRAEFIKRMHEQVMARINIGNK